MSGTGNRRAMYLPRIWSRWRSCPTLPLLPCEPCIEAMPAPGCSSLRVLVSTSDCRESSRWTSEQIFDTSDQRSERISPKYVVVETANLALESSGMAQQSHVPVNRSDACRCTLAIATQMTGSSSLTAVNLVWARRLRRSVPCKLLCFSDSLFM
jgi:hypothetical protein